jgi:hypothetical protein
MYVGQNVDILRGAIRRNAPNPMPNEAQGQSGHRPDRPSNEFERRLVRWTGAVALFTFMLFAANIVSNFFIYQQWRVANDAQTDTRAQLRAVVTLQGINANILNDKDGKLLAYAFQPVFVNSGGTRTAVFSAWQSIHYFEKDVPNNADFSKPYEKIDLGSGSVLGANGTSILQPVTLSADEVNKVIQRQGLALIWGHVEWADIFDPGKVHPINFCMTLEPVAAIGGPVVLRTVPYKAECNNAK